MEDILERLMRLIDVLDKYQNNDPNDAKQKFCDDLHTSLEFFAQRAIAADFMKER